MHHSSARPQIHEPAVVNEKRRTDGSLLELQQWLSERKVENVEIIVSDMAGIARGKIQPATQLNSHDIKLPIAVFAQTIASKFYMPRENIEDSDMFLKPDTSSLRLVPWTVETTASAIMDCYDKNGAPVGVSPRSVLRRVLEKYESRGWTPVVAPELEFHLTKASILNEQTDPYGIDRLHDLGAFFEQLSVHCKVQDIWLGGISQEMGPGQYEVNFQHGCPIKLADDVFHFKRTIKRVALEHEMRVTFLAKPTMDGPGSSMHIHQSIHDDRKKNLFTESDGTNSKLFLSYMGGLQKYLSSALLLFAPYANSYRRFLSFYSSPVNLEWGVDNRTVGLRVPASAADARRIENRLAGSDVNPYLAIAGTLACGLLGMTECLAPRPPIDGSAYELPFALHRHLYEALDAFSASEAMRDVLGDEFVTLYSKVKEMEYRTFQSQVSDWERNELAFIV